MDLLIKVFKFACSDDIITERVNDFLYQVQCSGGSIVSVEYYPDKKSIGETIFIKYNGIYSDYSKN